MNSWTSIREVERPKTVSERRRMLKADADKRVQQLQTCADAVLLIQGRYTPLVYELRQAAMLIEELARELRVPVETR